LHWWWVAFVLVCIDDGLQWWFVCVYVGLHWWLVYTFSEKYQNILSIIFLDFQNSENLIKPVVFQWFYENVNISLVLPLPVGDLSRIWA
jgi:hypothetical protein